MPSWTKVTTGKVCDRTGVQTLFATYLGDDSLALNDTLALDVPHNHRVMDLFLETAGVDTNVSAQAIFDVGTADSVDCFIDGAAAGDSGAFTRHEINELVLSTVAGSEGEVIAGTGLLFERADSLTGGAGGQIITKLATAAASAGTLPRLKLTVFIAADAL